MPTLSFVNFSPELSVINAVVLVSSWSFSLTIGGESPELLLELIYWNDLEFVKCPILREITIAFICFVLPQLR